MLTKPPSFYLKGVLVSLKDREIPVYSSNRTSSIGFLHTDEKVLAELRDDVDNIYRGYERLKLSKQKTKDLAADRTGFG